MTVYFYNEEPLDLAALRLMGVSVKTGDNPIGRFGTGLKYASAILLRTGHRIELTIGGRHYALGTREMTVRGQSLEIVTLEEHDPQDPTCPPQVEDLGFTTALGRDWEIWQAYRELACNATDENGHTDTAPPPAPQGTVIAVSGEGIEKAHRNRNEVFVEGEPDWKTDTVHMRRRSSVHGYFRGVRALKLERVAMFQWDVHEDLELTEDRTVKYSWIWGHEVAKAILTLNDEVALERILLADRSTCEGCLDYDWSTVTPSAAFLRVCERLASRTDVNQSAMRTYERHIGKSLRFRTVTPSRREEATITQALALVRKLECSLERWEFHVAETLGPNVLGLYHQGNIWLARSALDQGVMRVASTLYEEWLHKTHHLDDCSRSMQNYLFDRLIAVARELPVPLEAKVENDPPQPYETPGATVAPSGNDPNPYDWDDIPF